MTQNAFILRVKSLPSKVEHPLIIFCDEKDDAKESLNNYEIFSFVDADWLHSKLSKATLEHFANSLKLEFREYIAQIESSLRENSEFEAPQNAERSKIEFTLTKIAAPSKSWNFSIRKHISESVTMTLFEVRLENLRGQSDDVDSTINRLFAVIGRTTLKSERRLRNANTQNELITAKFNEVSQKYLELSSNQIARENSLIDAFTALINEKKKRIIDLEKQLETSKSHPQQKSDDNESITDEDCGNICKKSETKMIVDSKKQSLDDEEDEMFPSERDIDNQMDDLIERKVNKDSSVSANYDKSSIVHNKRKKIGPTNSEPNDSDLFYQM